jgi:hypothetical protein
MGARARARTKAAVVTQQPQGRTHFHGTHCRGRPATGHTQQHRRQRQRQRRRRRQGHAQRQCGQRPEPRARRASKPSQERSHGRCDPTRPTRPDPSTPATWRPRGPHGVRRRARVCVVPLSHQRHPRPVTTRRTGHRPHEHVPACPLTSCRTRTMSCTGRPAIFPGALPALPLSQPLGAGWQRLIRGGPRKKRANHNQLERKRRQYQKDRLADLRDAIPSLRGDKPSTVTILGKARVRACLGGGAGVWCCAVR